MPEPIVGVQYAEYTSDGTELPSVNIAVSRQEVGLVLTVDTFNMLGKPDVVRMLQSVIIALQDVSEELVVERLADKAPWPQVPRPDITDAPFEPTHMPFNPQPRTPGGR